MSILEVWMDYDNTCKVGEYLDDNQGKVINIEFVNDNGNSGDYGVRIETDKGHFLIIPNPVMIIGKKAKVEHDY